MGKPAQLIVLGSGTVLPSARRDTACYLLDDGLGDGLEAEPDGGAGARLLIDLGPGALHRAARAGYDLDRLSAILLTHVHPDHSADLVTLQFALKNPLPRRGLPPLEVWGHPEVRLLASRLRNAWPGWLAAGPQRLRLRDVEHPGPLELPGATRVTAFKVAHIPSSWGYRVELPSGFVVAFSGDASEGEQLEELGRDADLFVLEAAAADGQPMRGHLTPRRAGRVAAAAGARHLLLTHFYPSVENEPIEARVRESFEGQLTLAHDGAVLPLTP